MKKAITLPKLNDSVVAVHPKSGKKIQVTVTKVLKNSFHGKTQNSTIIPGFTKWNEPQPKPNPVKSTPVKSTSTPAKFKAGDRVRIISTGINGCGTVVEKNLDDPKNNDIYRIVLDGKNESELFPEDDLDNKIVLDFQPGDRVIVNTQNARGKIGTIIEKTEEDKESRFFNHLYRIQLDNEETSHLYAKDEFKYLSNTKPIETPETQITSIAQKQIDFLSFQSDSLDTGELNKDELLARAISEHLAIAGIEKEEAKLALFKLSHARNAGICFKSFKARCQHGEFENSVKSLGVSERVAQNYMQIATFWNCIEAKANCDSLLKECQTQTLSITWALGIIRDEKKSLKSAEPNKEPEQLPLFAPPTEQAITEGDNVEVAEDSYFDGKTGTVTGFTANGNKAVVRFDPDNDGCSPSGLIDLKNLNLKQTNFNSVAEELDEKAESLGLTNGKSVLPDLRNRDRSVAEKLDPTTVNDQLGYYPVEVIPQEYVKGTNLPIKYANGLPIRPVGPCEFDSEDDEEEENPHHEEDDESIIALVYEIRESEDPEYVIAGIINALLPEYKALIQNLVSVNILTEEKVR
ncbi:MAG: hypothetical protein ACRCT1_03270 [Microcoleaceae cyanobacterium]